MSHDRLFAIQWELGTVTYSNFDVDGYPIAQHDGLGEEPEIGSYELHHPFGFVSRPRDPDTDKDGKPLQGKACNALIGKQGNETHLFLASDPRFIPNIPQLKKGGAAMYSAPGSFRVLDGDDGTETFYYPVPGANKAHIITAGIDGNKKPYIGIEHCDGMAITMLEHSLVLKNASGSVYIELKDDGVVVNGNLVVNGGMTAGSPAGALPAAIATTLIAYLTALEQLIQGSLLGVGVGLSANGVTAAALFQNGAASLEAAKAAIAAHNTNIF